MYALIIVTACFGVLPCCAQYIVCSIFNYHCYEPGCPMLFFNIVCNCSRFDEFLCEFKTQFFFPNQGPVLAATQGLKQPSQMSSTADQRHLTGLGEAFYAFVSSANHDEREPEMLQRRREDLTTQADHTKGGILQEDLSVVQKIQNVAVLQTIADPGKQVLCYLYF